VYRWTQPAIEAALDLKRTHRFAADDVSVIVIESFRDAIALGSQCASPRTTEEAQYSITFPVAAALVFGKLGAAEVDVRGLSDARVQRLLSKVSLIEDAGFSRRFPAERWARVRVALADGRSFTSAPAQARGNPENPLSDEELHAKYRDLAIPVLGAERATRIEQAIGALLTDRNALVSLLADLLSPIH
jgi:2-methylcitrate dehydratase PrpD